MASKFKARLDDKNWRKAFKRLDVNLKRKFKAFENALQIVYPRSITQNFKRQADEKGVAWPKRKRETNIAYDRKGGKFRSSNKLLQIA